MCLLMSMYNILCVLLPQDGITPLAIAADRGHSSVVQLLLKAEAKTDVQDKVKTQPCFLFLAYRVT